MSGSDQYPNGMIPMMNQSNPTYYTQQAQQQQPQAQISMTEIGQYQNPFQQWIYNPPQQQQPTQPMQPIQPIQQPLNQLNTMQTLPQGPPTNLNNQINQVNPVSQMNQMNTIVQVDHFNDMCFPKRSSQNESPLQASPKGRTNQMSSPQRLRRSFEKQHTSYCHCDPTFVISYTQSPQCQPDQQHPDELSVVCPKCHHIFSPPELLNRIYQLTQELEECQKRLSRYEPISQQMSTSSIMNQPTPPPFKSSSSISSPINCSTMSEVSVDSPRPVENPLLNPTGKRTSLMNNKQQHQNEQRKMSRYALNVVSERLKQILIDVFGYTFETDARERTKKGMEQFYFKSASFNGEVFELKTFCIDTKIDLVAYGEKRLQTQIKFLYEHLTKCGCVVERDTSSRPGRVNTIGYSPFTRIILPENVTFEMKHVLTMDDILQGFKQQLSTSAPQYL